MGNNVEILGVRIDSVYTREAVATALRLAAADRGCTLSLQTQK